MLKDRVKDLCKENGISVRQLERECELGHATVLKWDVNEPTLRTLRKVAKYFGLTICELIGDDDG